MATNGETLDEKTALSEKYEKLEGSGPEPYSAFGALKERIKLHYDLASDYYLSLWSNMEGHTLERQAVIYRYICDRNVPPQANLFWRRGEHIHHGYWSPPDSTITKEEAQVQLIKLLLDISSAIPDTTTATTRSIRIVDVGCGIGGTSRFLAKTFGCEVTGITISTKQVEIAKRLSLQESKATAADADGFISMPSSSSSPTSTPAGKVKFIELDAEKMSDYFSSSAGTKPKQDFDIVWISEALSHFPNKPLFFTNAYKVLKPHSGKLVLADWFKKEDATEADFKNDLEPIEVGMLLPPLCTAAQYVDMAKQAGFAVKAGPKDISKEVARTWDITWSLIQSPSLWAFAFSQGRDGVAFLQSFRAMRRGYANGSFRYAVMAFEK